MGIIATENQAASIGGGSPYTNNLCCTKARAQALGCTVSGSYSDNQLVKLDNLSGLPASHRRVEYIQSTGSQYINTLIPSGNDCILTIDGLYDRETGDSQHGTLISGSDGRYHMGIHYHSFAGGMYDTDMHFWYWDTNRHTFEMNGANGYFYVDSDYRSLVPYQGSKSLNIYIFARNSNGTADCWTYFKLYECWIKNIIIMVDGLLLGILFLLNIQLKERVCMIQYLVHILKIEDLEHLQQDHIFKMYIIEITIWIIQTLTT